MDGGEVDGDDVNRDDRGGRVVRLTTDDPALARRTFALIAEIFDEEHTRLSDEHLLRILGDDDCWCYAVVVGGVPVGGARAHVLPMTSTDRCEVMLYDIAVHPDHQRRGLGRLLVGRLRADAASAGIDTVFVPADDDDTHALGFYRSLGGSPGAVTIFTFGNL